MGYQVRRDALQRVKPIVVLGDSKTQNGIIETDSNGISNFSNSGESYVYSYWKLKFLVDNHAPIEKVVLGYGNHNLNSQIDSLWNFSENSILEKYGAYWMFLNKNDWKDYRTQYISSPRLFFSAQKSIVAKSIHAMERKVLLGKIPYYGGYAANEKVHNSANKLSNRENDTSFTNSEIQLIYLNKVIALCKLKDIKLYLINAPSFGSKQTLRIEPVLEHQDVTILNYRDLISADSCFADEGHLNPRGAALLTSKLLEEIR